MRRLLVVLTALVGLVLGGLVAQEGSAAAGRGTGALVGSTAVTSAATATTTRVGGARSTVRRTSGHALVVSHQAEQTRAGAPAPVAVEPVRPRLSAPLLLGQLPRPPSTDAPGTTPTTPRGRGPPAPAGT